MGLRTIHLWMLVIVFTSTHDLSFFVTKTKHTFLLLFNVTFLDFNPLLPIPLQVISKESSTFFLPLIFWTNTPRKASHISHIIGTKGSPCTLLSWHTKLHETLEYIGRSTSFSGCLFSASDNQGRQRRVTLGTRLLEVKGSGRGDFIRKKQKKPNNYIDE